MEIPEDYTKRDLEDRLWKYMDKPEILAVTGPRQSGKTTLLQKIHSELENSRFISFEDRDALSLFEEDEKAFAEQYLEGCKYLIIDEFQYAEKGGKRLKYLYDTYPDKKILITGSSAAEMTIRSLKFLTGRVLKFNLFPFSFREFLRHSYPDLYRTFIDREGNIGRIISGSGSEISQEVISRLEEARKEYAVFGGYPRVVTSEDRAEKKKVLKEIVDTYLLREIREVLEISEDRKLKDLMKLLAVRMGEIAKYSSISNESGFKYKELKEKLNILEKTFVIKLVDPFHTNKTKEVVKAPKIYFYDNGFRNMLIENFQEPKYRKDQGELNENFFFTEAIRSSSLKYWRTKSKAEVDFIIEKEKPIPFEIKTTPKITRALRSFISKYGPEEAFVMNETSLERNEDVQKIPLSFASATVKAMEDHS